MVDKITSLLENSCCRTGQVKLFFLKSLRRQFLYVNPGTFWAGPGQSCHHAGMPVARLKAVKPTDLIRATKLLQTSDSSFSPYPITYLTMYTLPTFVSILLYVSLATAQVNITVPDTDPSISVSL